MSEMVARVADVVYRCLADDVQPPEEFARRVIAAMREPTEAMLVDAFAGPEWDWASEKRLGAKGVWQAMIDAALEDKP